MTSTCNSKKATNANWQSQFLTLLLEIETRLRNEFRDLHFNEREEAVREGIAHCAIAFVRLHKRDRAHVATAFTLARFAALHVRRGRPAAGRMNSKDPLSLYARVQNGFQFESNAGEWIDELVQDKRAPVLDQVAARLDVAAWLATLSKRLRQIAKDLGLGCTTREVAEKYGVTAGRVSQLRRSFERSWAEFQSDRSLTRA